MRARRFTLYGRRASDASPWTRPQTILGVVAILVSLAGLFTVWCGGLLSAYLVLRTQTTTSEISNASLAEKLTKMEAQLAQINGKLDDRTDDIQKVVNENIEQKGQIAQGEKRQESLAEDIKVNVSATNALRDRVSRLESK